MLTRNGVAYDLKKSPYKFSIKYDNEILTFKFSSELYLNKFKSRIDSNRLSITNSLSNRFGFNICNNKLCDIKLYSIIEKRGFLISSQEGLFECLNIIKLDGTNKIQKK